MRGRQWSDRGTAAATAVALHVAVLLLLGLVAPQLATSPRPDLVDEPLVEVELAPRFMRPADPVPARASERAQARADHRPEPARDAHRKKDRAPEPRLPQALPNGGTESGPPVAPDFRLPPGYGRQPDDAVGGGLRGVLRATVGCEHDDFARLSPAERDHCLTTFARDAGRGPSVDAVPAEKRSAYDVEAAANARRRAQREGSIASPVTACDGAGSNLGGGCLPPEAHSGNRPR